MIDQSTVSFIITVIFLIPIIWNTWRGRRRGVKREGVRIGCTVATAIVSFFTTNLICEKIMEYTTTEKIKELLASVDNSGDAVNLDALVDCLPSLELVLAMPVTVLVLPLVFTVSFSLLKIVFNIISGIICAIFKIKKPNKKTEEKQRKKQRALGGVIGFVEGLIISLVCMLPFVGIFGMLNDSVDVIRECEGETHSEFIIIYDENVAYIGDHFAVKATETLGGRALLNEFATYHINGREVNMRDEIIKIVSMAMEFQSMGDINFADLSEENKEAIKSAVASFQNSDYLTLIITGFISDMGKFMEDGVIPISVPAPYDVIWNPVVSMLATSNPENFKADIDTVVEVYFILSDYGVLKSFGKDIDAVSDAFTITVEINGENKTVVERVVDIINSNERTRGLVKAITDMSLTILSQSFGNIDFSIDITESYDNIKNGVMNVIKLDKDSYNGDLEKYEADRNELLNQTLTDNDIVLEADIIDGIGDFIDENYGDRNEITDEEFNNIILSYYQAYKDYIESEENQ